MIEELINLLGDEAFDNLACVFGGTKIYIGSTENSERKLAIVMGIEPAKKMIKAYGGGWLTVPKHAAAEIALRNKLIVEDFDAGITMRQLAEKYELTERHICNVLKNHHAQPKSNAPITLNRFIQTQGKLP